MPLNFDNLEFYSGSFSVTGQGLMTGQSITTGTTLSTNAIQHQVGFLPQGGAQNLPTLGFGERKLLLVQVTATVSTSTTVSLLTDSNANMTTTVATLASLTIPTTAPVGTIYALEIPPTLTFQQYSALQYVCTGSVGLAAWFAPESGLEGNNNYQSGWVIENS